MDPEQEREIQRFVKQQLGDAPDLSALTLGILRRRYLAHAGHESLSQEARSFIKKVVEEELTNMQNDEKDVNKSDPVPSRNKRKREEETGVDLSGEAVDEDESRAKKCRRPSSSSGDASPAGKDKEKKVKKEEEEEGISETGSDDSDEEQSKVVVDEVQKSRKSRDPSSGGDGAEEETHESKKPKKGKINGASNSDGQRKEEVKGSGKKAGGGRKRARGKSKEPESSASASDGGGEGEKENTPKHDSGDSSEDGENGGKVLTGTKTDERAQDSDSSSLPSLEDEQDGDREPAQGKKKGTQKKEAPKKEKDEDPAVLRLKRYIALCGVKRNYKKLLEGCRSVRSKVAVLRKELEELGVKGQPSIKSCKKARLKREEAQELAELDVSNILTTQGRPKRRGSSAWQERHAPPPSAYKHTVNSSSDSEEDGQTGRGRRRATDWANLQGIISDDGDSS